MTSRHLAILLRDAAAIHGPAITPSKFLSMQPGFEHQLLASVLAAWPQLRREAGLAECAPRFGRKRFSDDDLLVEYDRVRSALGKDPTWAEINRHSAVSRQTYQDRIGTIRELRAMHHEWADLRDRAASGDPEAGATLAHRTRTLPAANPFAALLPDLTFLPPLSESIPSDVPASDPRPPASFQVDIDSSTSPAPPANTPALRANGADAIPHPAQITPSPRPITSHSHHTHASRKRRRKQRNRK